MGNDAAKLGRIINIASVAGMITSIGAVGHST
jgi:hypothetical protein